MDSIAKFLDKYGFGIAAAGFVLGITALLLFQGSVGTIIFSSMCGLIVATLIFRVFLPIGGKG